jgi:hypothetical protein
VVVDVNPDDAGTARPCDHHRSQADTAAAEDRHRVTGADARHVDDAAVGRREPAAEAGGHIERQAVG